MSPTTVAGQRGSSTSSVWVRRCGTCGADDLRAAFGQPAIIDGRGWRCPACSSSTWSAGRLDLPAEPGSDRCPYLGGGR